MAASSLGSTERTRSKMQCLDDASVLTASIDMVTQNDGPQKPKGKLGVAVGKLARINVDKAKA